MRYVNQENHRTTAEAATIVHGRGPVGKLDGPTSDRKVTLTVDEAKLILNLTDTVEDITVEEASAITALFAATYPTKLQ